MKTYRSKIQGIALVIVLWMMSLMLMLAGGLVYSVKTEVEMTQHIRHTAQARAYADAAVHYAVAQLHLPADFRELRTSGIPFQWQYQGMQAEISVIGENGLIDINLANRNLMREALRQINIIDTEADQLLDAIEDFRDRDDLRRLNGAEDRDYEDQDLPYGAKDAPLERIEELQQVLGVTPEIYEQLARLFTVTSQTPGINPMLASRPTLLVLAEGDTAAVDAYIQQREQADGEYIYPTFGARYLTRKQQPNYRIQVKIRMEGSEKAVPYFEERSIRLNRGKSPPFITYFKVTQKLDNAFLK